jgi:hypothetical protein
MWGAYVNGYVVLVQRRITGADELDSFALYSDTST